jgi:hemolysin D
MSNKQQLAVIAPVKREIAAPTSAGGAGGASASLRIINEFQSDATEIETLPEPMLARITLWVLATALVTALVWASIARIDRVVSAPGKFVAVSSNIVVQPLDAAVIRSIDVKAGDIVQAGQVLARLDPTFTAADVEQIESKMASLDAVISRLEAEQFDRPFTPTTGDRFGYQQLQYAIWDERRVQYEAQMRLFDEKTARARAALVARQEEAGHLASRLKILREVESMRNELESAKTGSRLNSLLAKDSRIEVERNKARAETGIVEAEHELEGVAAERDVFHRQWQSKLVEELVTKRNERDGLSEALVKAQRRQEMIELKTPVDAVVLEVAQRSVGSIIQSAEAMFRLVPLGAPLEVEAKVEAKEIGRIAVGDPVRLKLEAAPFTEHGAVDGVVKIISSDAFVDSRNGNEAAVGAYYKVRVGDLNLSALRNLPETFRVLPGLPLTVEIKIGTRTVISYFLRPITRGLNESMREP